MELLILKLLWLFIHLYNSYLLRLLEFTFQDSSIAEDMLLAFLHSIIEAV